MVEREKGVSSDRSWVVAEDLKKRENTKRTCLLQKGHVYLLENNFILKSEF